MNIRESDRGQAIVFSQTSRDRGKHCRLKEYPRMPRDKRGDRTQTVIGSISFRSTKTVIDVPIPVEL